MEDEAATLLLRRLVLYGKMGLVQFSDDASTSALLAEIVKFMDADSAQRYPNGAVMLVVGSER